jgi:hypothetical protein
VTLARELRKQLETTCIQARSVAEAAAEDVIARVKAGPDSPMRRKLRAQEQEEAEHFLEHAAFTQWHVRLFARFLAENNLLRHPDGVAVTLDEVKEIATEERKDPWALAAEYACQMLPGIFPTEGDMTTELPLAPEHRQALERLVEDLPLPCFTSEDALGWTYQFWQTQRKNEVNRTEEKVEGDDLSAVTQLFTERYMVRFLLQNTLGAWWAHHRPASPLINGYIYYKPSIEHDFSNWPVEINELKVLDPCCGSGHFLVEAFLMLHAMRLELGEDQAEAARAVLTENIFGLELDDRCIQIAAFALNLVAWKSGLPASETVVPNLACTGLAVRGKAEEWAKLARGDSELEHALLSLRDLLYEADSIGSLLEPEKELQRHTSGMFTSGLERLIYRALVKERAEDSVAAVFGEQRGAAQFRALNMLVRRDFHLVATNPPFLNTSKAIRVLQEFVAENFPEAKKDLATAFLLRAFAFLRPGGLVAMVTPQNWLFLGSDRKLREKLLKEQRWLAVARFGPGAFETITGEVVQVANVILAKHRPRDDNNFLGIDASEPKKAVDKAALLAEATP